MVSNCIVPNCPMRSRTCTEKATLFKIPKGMLEKWQKSIPRYDRALTCKDHVCSKHFTPESFGPDRYYSEYNGKVILDQPKRVNILPGAVPTIFPNQILKTLRPRKRPADRASAPSARGKSKKSKAHVDIAEGCISRDWSKAPKTYVGFTGSGICKGSKKPKTGAVFAESRTRRDLPQKPPADAELPESCVTRAYVGLTGSGIGNGSKKPKTGAVLAESRTRQDLPQKPPTDAETPESCVTRDGEDRNTGVPSSFDWECFKANIETIPLPSDNWARFVSEDEEFQSITFLETIMTREKPCRCVSRQLVIYHGKRDGIGPGPEDDSFSCKAYIFSHEIPISAIIGQKPLTNFEEIRTALFLFAAQVVCKGGQRAVRGYQLRSAYVDITSSLRHVNCTFLCTGKYEAAKQCPSCIEIPKSIARILLRRRKNGTHLCPGLPPTPASKTVERLRKSLHLKKKSEMRFVRMQAKMEKQVNLLQSQLEKMTAESTLQSQLEGLNLHNNQKLLLQECISLGKKSAIKGRRYTGEWLMLCLLLYTKNKETYDFLREQEILPLPGSHTIKRYRNMMKSIYGI